MSLLHRAVTSPVPLVSSSRRSSSLSSSSSGLLLLGLQDLEVGVAGEEEVGEEEEEEEAGEGESGSLEYQKTLMEEEKEGMSALQCQNPPPERRNRPSHWPGRRCPSHASQQLIGREQRGKAVGVVADRSVTEGMGDHVEG